MIWDPTHPYEKLHSDQFILGSYWHPPGPNVEPTGHHWGQSRCFINWMKGVVIFIYWYSLTVSVWGLVPIAEIFLVGCQSHTGTPRVAGIKAKPRKNAPNWVKIGAFYNLYCSWLFCEGYFWWSFTFKPWSEIQHPHIKNRGESDCYYVDSC